MIQKGKRKTDYEDSKKKGKNNRYKKGKGGNRGRGRGGRRKADPEAMCQIHKDHKSTDCPNNLSSPNCISRTEAAGRGGRGGRDTASGRGEYGGRGGYHTQTYLTHPVGLPKYQALPPSDKSNEKTSSW